MFYFEEKHVEMIIVDDIMYKINECMHSLRD